MAPKTRSSINPKEGTVQNSARQVRQLCLEHASDLVASAERILKDNGFANIAYHLSVLALEETGKAGMIASRAVIGGARDTDWIDKRFGDHVWKIQWAIWSACLTRGRIDHKDFEEARRFAKRIHSYRLAGLYVDPHADVAKLAPPRDAVTVADATACLNLARTHLELEQVSGGPILDEPNEDLAWFLDTVSDENGKKRIFSKPFLDRHEELKGNTRAWVAWARQEFERIAAHERDCLKKELARLPGTTETGKPKWLIKIRLYTPSHSVRPKVLNYWNKRINWVKLSPVSNKKHEVLLVLTLHDSVPLARLYDAGLSFSKLCIAALNIGSLGYFWYDLPRQTSRYFESIRDLDARAMDVHIGKLPGLLGDWKQGALSEKNLQHAIECVAMFGPMSDKKAAPIFGPYLHGLVLFSKSDIHFSCEDQARDMFIKTLRKACKHFGDWNGVGETFVPSLHRVFECIIPELRHRERLFDILAPPHKTGEGSFADAVSAKRLADLYLILVANRCWTERIKRQSSNPA